MEKDNVLNILSVIYKHLAAQTLLSNLGPDLQGPHKLQVHCISLGFWSLYRGPLSESLSKTLIILAYTAHMVCIPKYMSSGYGSTGARQLIYASGSPNSHGSRPVSM